MELYQAVGLAERISAADNVRFSVLFVIGDFHENSMTQFRLG
jgi:hypothetical protein